MARLQNLKQALKPVEEQQETGGVDQAPPPGLSAVPDPQPLAPVEQAQSAQPTTPSAQQAESAPAPAAQTPQPPVQQVQQQPAALPPAPEPVTAAVRPAKKNNIVNMERKETRIFYEQLEALTLLMHRVNRGKAKGQGERVTENTLIRIGIDLMLQRKDDLRGHTEDELRASVGLPPIPEPDL